MSDIVEPPQPNNANLIDALADYFVLRGAQETKAEMIDKLTAMNAAQLKHFADLTLAEVARLDRTAQPERSIRRRR